MKEDSFLEDHPPKMTRLLNAESVQKPAVSAWEMTAFLTEEQKVEKELAQEAQEVEEIKQARAEAERITQEAHQKGYDIGYKEGMASGYEAGLQQAQTEQQTALKEKLADADKILNGLISPYAQLEDEVFRQLGKVVIDLSRQIIGDSVKADEQYVVRAFKEALAELPQVTHPIEVYVHPDDIEALREALNQSKELAPEGWKLHADANLEKGSVHLQHHHSTVLNDWKERMERTFSKQLNHFVHSNESDS